MGAVSLTWSFVASFWLGLVLSFPPSQLTVIVLSSLKISSPVLMELLLYHGSLLDCLNRDGFYFRFHCDRVEYAQSFNRAVIDVGAALVLSLSQFSMFWCSGVGCEGHVSLIRYQLVVCSWCSNDCLTSCFEDGTANFLHLYFCCFPSHHIFVSWKEVYALFVLPGGFQRLSVSFIEWLKLVHAWQTHSFPRVSYFMSKMSVKASIWIKILLHNLSPSPWKCPMQSTKGS